MVFSSTPSPSLHSIDFYRLFPTQPIRAHPLLHGRPHSHSPSPSSHPCPWSSEPSQALPVPPPWEGRNNLLSVATATSNRTSAMGQCRRVSCHTPTANTDPRLKIKSTASVWQVCVHIHAPLADITLDIPIPPVHYGAAHPKVKCSTEPSSPLLP